MHYNVPEGLGLREEAGIASTVRPAGNRPAFRPTPEQRRKLLTSMPASGMIGSQPSGVGIQQYIKMMDDRSRSRQATQRPSHEEQHNEGLYNVERGMLMRPRTELETMPAPSSNQRPVANPVPDATPSPANQRPAGYGTTPKPAPSTWTQKIKDYQNGLAGPVNAPIEFRRHANQQYQRLINSPFAQRFIDRLRSGNK